jgi:hypothetical protein
MTATASADNWLSEFARKRQEAATVRGQLRGLMMTMAPNGGWVVVNSTDGTLYGIGLTEAAAQEDALESWGAEDWWCATPTTTKQVGPGHLQTTHDSDCYTWVENAHNPRWARIEAAVQGIGELLNAPVGRRAHGEPIIEIVGALFVLVVEVLPADEAWGVFAQIRLVPDADDAVSTEMIDQVGPRVEDVKCIIHAMRLLHPIREIIDRYDVAFGTDEAPSTTTTHPTEAPRKREE